MDFERTSYVDEVPPMFPIDAGGLDFFADGFRTTSTDAIAAQRVRANLFSLVVDLTTARAWVDAVRSMGVTTRVELGLQLTTRLKEIGALLRSCRLGADEIRETLLQMQGGNAATREVWAIERLVETILRPMEVWWAGPDTACHAETR